MSSENCFSEGLDCILGIRDDIGVGLGPVCLVTRTWSGERVGDGSYTEVITKMLPTPEIKDFSHDVRVSDAGAIKSGDLILKTIDKNRFSEDELRTDTGEEKIEKFIKVKTHRYRTIHIKEKVFFWDVHIRKVSEDETERR